MGSNRCFESTFFTLPLNIGFESWHSFGGVCTPRCKLLRAADVSALDHPERIYRQAPVLGTRRGRLPIIATPITATPTAKALSTSLTYRDPSLEAGSGALL